MLDFFSIKNRYYNLGKRSIPPKEVALAVNRMKEEVKYRYLMKYLDFYDILCINIEGEVFHTIRKQADYHKNIFSSEFKNTSLSQKLKEKPGESFVDFQYYDVSGEPSAFFLQPVLRKGELYGWFALQYSTNKINRMFSGAMKNSLTGEVILVNRSRFMLTDSRFHPNSTILKKRLSAENIEDKFRLGEGRKCVVDYRGNQVLSSFRVCPVSGSEWLLIAKINKAEVLTGFFRNNSRKYAAALLEKSSFPVESASEWSCPKNCTTEVDMDEFRRIDSCGIIYTHGVSTCTALLVTMPGRFSYMAHISNIDQQYGGGGTDLLASVFRHIKDFDVSRYQIQALSVIIAAADTAASSVFIESLVQQGLFLSQIKYLCREDCDFLNLYHCNETGRSLVEWIFKGRPEKTEITRTQNCGNLLDVFSSMIGDKGKSSKCEGI
ncbi:MAG: hypothetical protein ACLFQK_09700 [Fibrobacterota bacterium]